MVSILGVIPLKNDIRDLVYVHLNENEHYVLSYGVEFKEFVSTHLDLINNILLLKHGFDDGDLNMHTLLEYVPQMRLKKLIQDDVYSYGDFCWIDFEEIEGLNELPGHELAELLYLGHIKEHLKPPFYNYLRNRFVYLAHDDGWWNKVYYRHINDFYRLLSDVISEKLSRIKLEKNLLGIKKKRSYASVHKEVILSLKGMMKEGLLFSIKDAKQNRLRIELPIYVIGDFLNMDDMYDEYERVKKGYPDGKLVYDKKTREWNYLSN